MWTITRNGRGRRHDVLEMSAGISALKAFDHACDDGPLGQYELKAGDIVLATAVAKTDEYHVSWRKPWIFYAMGQEQIAQGLEAMWDYLAER